MPRGIAFAVIECSTDGELDPGWPEEGTLDDSVLDPPRELVRPSVEELFADSDRLAGEAR